MANEKNIYALSGFFSKLFHNFPKLILTNIIFSLPFALFFGVFYFINNISGLGSNFILFLTAIPLFPFYAGVTLVTSHMVRGEQNIRVFSTFLRGVKDNFKKFLVHGIIFYLAIFFSYYSIIMYISFGKQNSMFYTFLVLCILISVFFLFMFFYISPMTVTFDISLKNIYKNSALMTFGEFKHNLFATFGLLILFLVCATVLLCCFSSVAVIIATILLLALFVPSLVSFIINSAVYSCMYNMIVNKDSTSKNIDKKMENRKQGVFVDEEEKEDLLKTFSNINVDKNADGDEYIFYQGKMVKRSTLLQHKEQDEIERRKK